MSFQIHHGDALSVLRTLPDGLTHCCVTSPPYFGLRDYGVDGQIGLERTPEEFISRLVEVFREVRRVLRPDGTLWVNIGDSYNAHPGQRKATDKPGHKQATSAGSIGAPSRSVDGMKPKDLIGIPWMLAFALRADGWYLRSDIIWHKPNPMPESVTDRPTKAHEYLFLMAKSERYFYDADAIKEATLGLPAPSWEERKALGEGNRRGFAQNAPTGCHRVGGGETRNKRTVWTLATLPTKDAHFATYPIELPETCIRAGCPPEGKRCDCAEVIETPTGSGCIEDPTLTTGRAGMNRPRKDNEGTRPITRYEQRQYAEQIRESPHRAVIEEMCGQAFARYIRTDSSGARPLPPSMLAGLIGSGMLKQAKRVCDCPIEPAGIVLDPFSGAATTGLAALKNGRRYIGIELNQEYIDISHRRLNRHMPLFTTEATA